MTRAVALRIQTKANDRVLSRLLGQEGINLSHCKMYGKPKSILTGRDAQFYATSKEGKAQGETYFQKFLHSNGIGHTLARVNNPQDKWKA